MLYVLDATAIVSVPLKVTDASEVFLGLTDLLDDNSVCFCDDVIEELKRTAKASQPLQWAKSSADKRFHQTAGYNFFLWVGRDFRALIDATARSTAESAAVYVIAQALELRKAGHDVTVVTEDRRPKPTRASLLEACQHFEIPCMTLLEFLEEVGILDEDDDDVEVEDLDWSEGEDDND